MSSGVVLAAAIGAVGVGLLAGGLRASRPDPVRRGLGAAAVPATSWLDQAFGRWDAWVGASRQRDSLRLLGMSATEHRRRRLLLVAGSCAAAAAFGGLRSGLPAALLLAALAVPAGLLAAERWLHARAARRRAVLAAQVLSVAQTVALSLSAGETASESIGRAAAVAPEPIRRWLEGVEGQIRSGRPMEAALTEVADTLDVAEFSLLVDTLVAATARGAPLAATLTAQVRDLRARHRAAALERAGRADIAMLLPVVFGVLPAVVIVALFPGFVALSSM